MNEPTLADRVTQFIAASPDRTVDEIARGVCARTVDVRKELYAGCSEGRFLARRQAGNLPKLYRLALAGADRVGRAARVSQCSLIASVLRDGRWHSTAEIHQRCGYSRLNSRIAELRDPKRRFGMEIECRHIDGVSAGPEAQEYRFVGYKPGFGPDGRIVETSEGVAAVAMPAAAPSGASADGPSPESDGSPTTAEAPGQLDLGAAA